MLKTLSLSNFVIAKSCSISFEAGFNVLSGETGTGKTMLMQALALLLGQKADIKVIRKGEEKAAIQAVFEECDPRVYHFLIEAGIEIEMNEDLLISRELNLSGKNKIFINSQPAALPLLKQLAPYLVEIISQHSQLLLKESEIQRNLLDQYGSLIHLREIYKSSFLKEEELSSQVQRIQEHLHQMHHQLPLWKESVKEIQSINLQKDEEEILFLEYKKISHLQDLLKLGSSVFSELSEEPLSILDRLKKMQKNFEKLVQFDEHLASMQQQLINSSNALSELSFQFSRYMNDLEQEPQRFEEIEARLTSIKSLHKKYGMSFAEIEQKKITFLENIDTIAKIELQLDNLLKELNMVHIQRNQQALELSELRAQKAAELSLVMTEYLQTLNMADARFNIERKDIPPCIYGCDEISFQLGANKGEDFYKIKDHASGGELSRILFTLKLILAEKEKHQTLIFDEIDANIGGVTASLLGKQLQHLGKSRQVICITHFPQVAAYADHHMQMNKIQSDGRMITEVKTLSAQEKQEELLRMMGGTALLFHQDT